MRHPVPLRQARESGALSIDALATASGVPLSSLQDAIREANTVNGIQGGDEKLGPTHQQALAKLFGFVVQTAGPRPEQSAEAWPEWIDPAAKVETRPRDRRDTAAKFEERYIREFGERRDTSVPIMQADDRDPERCSIRGLASFELQCGQTEKNHTRVGALISCGTASIDPSPFSITVHAVAVEIDCGRARAAEGTIKGLTTPGFAVQGSQGEVNGAWTGGDTQLLRWILESTVSSLGVVKFEPGELARIERIAPGDVITGSLGTWLKNISADPTSPPRTVDEIAVVDRLGRPVEMPAQELSTLQLRIIEHLRKRVLDVDDAGYAVLSRHELHFVKRRD